MVLIIVPWVCKVLIFGEARWKLYGNPFNNFSKFIYEPESIPKQNSRRTSNKFKPPAVVEPGFQSNMLDSRTPESWPRYHSISLLLHWVILFLPINRLSIAVFFYLILLTLSVTHIFVLSRHNLIFFKI